MESYSTFVNVPDTDGIQIAIENLKWRIHNMTLEQVAIYFDVRLNLSVDPHIFWRCYHLLCN